MKKFLLLFSLFAGITSSAQDFNPLYIGYAEVSSTLGSTINVYDTTGGSPYTLVGTISLTTDLGTTVTGCHGLDLNPLTQELYILYQDNVGGNLNRRIGVLDTVSGVIADIGDAGNMTDITFRNDGTMYATSGSPVGRALYDMDPSTGASTLLSTYTLGPSYGNGFGYDPFGDRILYTSQSPAYVAEIDLTTYTETNLGVSGHPGWTNSLEVMTADEALIIHGTGLYFYDMAAGSITFLFSNPSGEYGHALSFGSNGLSVIVDGPKTFCLNEPSILAASDTATTYQWLLDDAPIAGATDSTVIPVASGDYSWIQNGTDTSSSQTITVLPIPTAGFTIDPNPLDLGFVPSGDVNFTNTSTDGDDYHWDFDNGLTTTMTDATISFPTTGTYDIELIVVDTVTGCSDTLVQTLTVINSTGIDELSADFSIYPVPTQDIVFVNMSGAEGNYQVEMRDIQGKLISSKTVSADSKSLNFDLTDYEAGTYLINIFNDQEEGSFKVIKK